MRKKMTLQKATMAAGVAAMTLGLVGTFDAEANGGSYCNGGSSFYACGIGDVYNIRVDFQNNCCAGSTITILDLCSGGGNQITQWINYTHGSNSSCANP